MKTEQLYKIFRQQSAGITTDSRTVARGQIFFALRGHNHDGNRFISDALAKGAFVAITDDPAYENEKTILVDDCLTELQALATLHRKTVGAKVLAITGTNGKTTTKELIAAVLAKKFRVHKTSGNLNNEIGLPLTILAAPEGTEIMVLEMGANHIGEIRSLCSIAMPDFGIITNIGTAHIEGFGSADGVLRTKTELYEYLVKVNGVAIFNDNDPVLAGQIIKTGVRAVPFSSPAGKRLTIKPMASELNLCVRVRYQHRLLDVSTMLFGSYNLENVQAAFAAGMFMGVGIDEMAEAVAGYQPTNNRSEVRVTASNTLVCDSYNANPTSMSGVIRSFSNLRNKDKALILGDMLELGECSHEEHLRILELLELFDPSSVYLVGPIFQETAENTDYKSFQDVDSLAGYLRENPLRNKLVLIKGSRKMTLEKLYDLL
jgi:UDP-N-acetylmuramoyl-tripeptide--D-alanyl-D-alanine ligase